MDEKTMDEKPQVKKLKLDKSTVKDLQASVDTGRAAPPNTPRCPHN